jgi:hypothetical protein
VGKKGVLAKKKQIFLLRKLAISLLLPMKKSNKFVAAQSLKRKKKSLNFRSLKALSSPLSKRKQRRVKVVHTTSSVVVRRIREKMRQTQPVVITP